MCAVEVPLFVIYLSAGAYIAIMLAVLGVPQLLSSYFDLRARRLDRLENEANAERRHQENLAAEERREERREEERREERRRAEEQRRRDEELRRQEMRSMEQRHQELMVAVVAAVSRENGHSNGRSELIQTLQQTIEDLRGENEQLRRERDNGDAGQSQ